MEKMTPAVDGGVNKSDDRSAHPSTPTPPARQGLYDPRFEHDACGIGFVANVKGRRSNLLLRQALQVLENLSHRGALGSEPDSGDGAGILLQTPHAFLRMACAQIGVDLPGLSSYAAGMLFLPPDPEERADCERLFAAIVGEQGQQLLGWRTVPTDNSSLGKTARASEPFIRQAFVGRRPDMSDDAFERVLYSPATPAARTVMRANWPPGLSLAEWL